MERPQEPPRAGQEAYVARTVLGSTRPDVRFITVMRLGKPLEHLQAALRAASSVGQPGEQITTIGRQLGYFGYLTHDALVWVRVIWSSAL